MKSILRKVLLRKKKLRFEKIKDMLAIMLFNVMANNTKCIYQKIAAMIIVINLHQGAEHGLFVTQSEVIDKKLNDKKIVPAAIDKTCMFQIRAQYT